MSESTKSTRQRPAVYNNYFSIFGELLIKDNSVSIDYRNLQVLAFLHFSCKR